MCEAHSPPTVGSYVYVTWPLDRPVPEEGEVVTEPWGEYDVDYRVDHKRGPGKLSGRERLDCTVMDVRLPASSPVPGDPDEEF